MRIVDLLGRVIGEYNNILPNTTTRLGGKYLRGIYIAEIRQGKEKLLVKLFKL